MKVFRFMVTTVACAMIIASLGAMKRSETMAMPSESNSSVTHDDLEWCKESQMYLDVLEYLVQKEVTPWDLVERLKPFCNQFGVHGGAYLLRDCLEKTGKRLEDIKGQAPLTNGWTALHWAAQESDPYVANLLLNSSDNAYAFACIRRADGRTALHLAAWRGHIEIVKLLIETTELVSGARTACTLINMRANNTETALALAQIRTGDSGYLDKQGMACQEVAEYLHGYLLSNQ